MGYNAHPVTFFWLVNHGLPLETSLPKNRSMILGDPAGSLEIGIFWQTVAQSLLG